MDGADVVAFGADPTGTTDSWSGIQAALNSGKATIYFPHGQYLVTRNIVVPPTVRRIEGLCSTIRKMVPNQVDWRYPIFRVQNTVGAFEVAHLNFDNTNGGWNMAFGPYGVKPFLVRDSFNNGIQGVVVGWNADGTFHTGANGGKVFTENICSSGVILAGPVQVWARQLNVEGNGAIAQAGTDLWILGIKTEANIIAVHSLNGKAEVLGGLVYSVHTANPDVPAMKNTDGKMLVSYVEEGFSAGSSYTTQVQDVQAGVTTNHTNSKFPPRDLAGRGFHPRIVPRFSTH
jgi:hypothetical protein